MMEGWERSICFDATIHLNVDFCQQIRLCGLLVNTTSPEHFCYERMLWRSRTPVTTKPLIKQVDCLPFAWCEGSTTLSSKIK